MTLALPLAMEPADFAATVAALQEQIDALNAEVGHRKLISTGDIDTFWLLFGGVLVFWMQAGFAMLEVGSVSKKNTKNILVKNIFDACAAASGPGAFLSARGKRSLYCFFRARRAAPPPPPAAPPAPARAAPTPAPHRRAPVGASPR